MLKKMELIQKIWKIAFFFSCDNPPCINPEHLWEGTHKDNIQDMMRKGRGNYKRGGGVPKGVYVGERHPQSKTY